jgi:hypothetical protein
LTPPIAHAAEVEVTRCPPFVRDRPRMRIPPAFAQPSVPSYSQGFSGSGGAARTGMKSRAAFEAIRYERRVWLRGLPAQAALEDEGSKHRRRGPHGYEVPVLSSDAG